MFQTLLRLYRILRKDLFYDENIHLFFQNMFFSFIYVEITKKLDFQSQKKPNFKFASTPSKLC